MCFSVFWCGIAFWVTRIGPENPKGLDALVLGQCRILFQKHPKPGETWLNADVHEAIWRSFRAWDSAITAGASGSDPFMIRTYFVLLASPKPDSFASKEKEHRLPRRSQCDVILHVSPLQRACHGVPKISKNHVKALECLALASSFGAQRHDASVRPSRRDRWKTLGFEGGETTKVCTAGNFEEKQRSSGFCKPGWFFKYF